MKTQKYRVVIPKFPLAMNNHDRYLEITLSAGDGQSIVRDYWLKPYVISFEFELLAEFRYIYDCKETDSPVFTVRVTSYNKTKTRSQTKGLVPQKC